MKIYLKVFTAKYNILAFIYWFSAQAKSNVVPAQCYSVKFTFSVGK
jgi:hypothetical protein